MTGQFPNVPLIAAVVLDVISYLASGNARLWCSRGANLAFVIWSVMELGWGANPFRRILGAVVLALAGTALFRSLS